VGHARISALVVGAGLIVLNLGSLGTTAGYAFYLRSGAYRGDCERKLSERLGLESGIGRVVPRSTLAREFQDIEVWLPDRRARAHTCERAILEYLDTPGDPHAYVLRLFDGSSEISSRTWLRSDYRNVVNAGLRPGFIEGGPHRVHFEGMRLALQREQLSIVLSDAAGSVIFDGHALGRATAACRVINGYRCAEPAILTASFSPTPDGVRMEDLRLSVENLPLSATGLSGPLGSPTLQGRFRGEVEYNERGGRNLLLRGSANDVQLSELTQALPNPVRGSMPEIVVSARLAGSMVDVALGDVLALLGISGGTGSLRVTLADAQLGPAGVIKAVASGQCPAIELETVSAAAGFGRLSGSLRLELRDLTIVDNRIDSLLAVVSAEPGGDGKCWIEGRLLRELALRLLKLDLPPLLPERIEYVKLGMRLEVHDERLHIYGSHGPGDKTILTVRLLGNELPLVKEPENPIDLRASLDAARTAAADRIRRRLAAFAASQAAGASP
jgi:hypothetical protein